MLGSHLRIIFLIFLYALVQGTHNFDYSDLQALGVACPERDKCAGYRNNLDYMERSCECDFSCTSYKDCCIDANRRRFSGRSATQSSMTCMNYGENLYSGVYVVANCSSNWNGPLQLRQRCEGPTNFSDPMTAAPVTNIAQAVTYKNLFCAECNNANMASLKTFQFRVACDGLDLPQEQILGDMHYNQQQDIWGINRMDDRGNSSFVECQIIFEVPSYLNRSVRFCRSNLISKCARNWTRMHVRTACEEYMAVVYDSSSAYRNPHCAICNHKRVTDVTCRSFLFSRKRPMSFALLLDVNQSDGDQVGMTPLTTPECASGHKYDPFFKKCRKLMCALPGHVVVNGKCVPGN